MIPSLEEGSIPALSSSVRGLNGDARLIGTLASKKLNEFMVALPNNTIDRGQCLTRKVGTQTGGKVKLQLVGALPDHVESHGETWNTSMRNLER